MSSSYFLHSSSPLKSCSKLWILICKNKSVHLANPVNATIIVLTPIFFFLFSQIEFIINAQGERSFPETKYSTVELEVPNVTSIYYSPINHVLEDVVLEVAKHLESPKIESYLYADEMNEALKQKDGFVGIEFEDHFRNIIKMPPTVRVALRFPFHSKSNPKLTWSNRLFKRNAYRPGIDIYQVEGFLFLQLKLSEAIIRSENQSAQIPEVHIRCFPDTALSLNTDLPFTFKKLIMIFFLIFMCPSVIICQMIVAEKQRFLRDMMQIMGLPTGLNWLSWFIVTFLMLMIPALVITILMRCFLCIKSNILVLIFIFIIYILRLISLTFVVSALFSNSFLAMIVLCIMHIISYLPFFISDGKEIGMSKSLVICICMNSAMPLIFIQILGFELHGTGVQWANMFQCFHPDDSLSYGSILLEMIFTTLICMLFCLYLDQLKPGGLRVSKKWYFPFTRQFYCPPLEPIGVPNEDDQPRSSTNHENTLAFEEVLHKNAVIIDSRKLCKAFGEKMAVRNFSLKFYENEITALLGHNGAGKTVIFMMLAGLYAPTSGQVLINGYDMAIAPHKALKNVCICPQQDIFFEELSAFWHINFYSRLKGLSRWNAEQEAYSYLYKINLRSKSKTKVKNLSTDMRRKLSLCCALCAGSKVVLCDEPSAYLDPSACRDIWDLLLTEKEGRCILLNTYSVNAAAVLGDRIGIISDGELIGYGTSDFLINNLGPGYRLVCVKLPECNVFEVTQFLQRKLRDVRLEKVVGSEITYRLPTTNMSKFPSFFRALERKLDVLRLASFGVSAPTMDETFLKIGADKMYQFKSSDFNAANEWIHDGKTIQEISKNQRFVNAWHGMIMKKLLYTRYYLVSFSWFIILPMIVTFLNLSFDLMEREDHEINIPSFTDLKQYPGPIVVRDWEHSGLLMESIIVDNSKEMAIEYDNVAMLAGATVLSIRNGLENYLMNNVDLKGEGFNKTFVAGATFRRGSVTAWFNHRLMHGQPMSVSLAFKAIGQYLASVDIEIINKPRNSSNLMVHKEAINSNARNNAAFIMVYLSIVMTIFIMLPIQERVTKMKQQQLLSGISLYTYWLSHLLWDYLLFLLMVVSLIISFFQKSSEMLYELFLYLLIFGLCALSFVYLLSFAFKQPYIGMSSVIFFNIVIVIVAITAYGNRMDSVYYIIHCIFLIVPHYAMYTAVLHVLAHGNAISVCESLNLITCDGPCCQKEPNVFFNWLEISVMLISGIIYFILVLLLSKMRQLGCAIKRHHREGFEIENEDQDVVEQRKQVDKIIKNEVQLKNCSVVCDKIAKVFRGVVPVNCVSFKISPYECFGLLGLSGAGKTCIIDMIVGNQKTSEGNIYVKGFSMKTEARKCFNHMGYCPQQYTVLNYMTGRQMLKFACLIRGIQKQFIDRIIQNLAESFVFSKHLDQMTFHYSNGNKRKLNIAMAVLSPTLICLDDPITDVDIRAKHEISTMLSQVRSYGKSLLITSQSVSDCEVLCSCLSIIVNGKLRCIGSVQQLKTRFNRGISIKIQVGTKEEMEEIRTVTNYFSIPSFSGSYTRTPDNKISISQSPSGIAEESPNEKGVQVKIKRKKHNSDSDLPSSSPRVTTTIKTPTIEQSIGRGKLVMKPRKSSATRRTTVGLSYTGSSLFNVFITSNEESAYFHLLLDVENTFKTDFPSSYVTETFTCRGLVTITIPDKDLKWSQIFKYMEDHRFLLQIKHYSISQTTLEDIFLNFVQSSE